MKAVKARNYITTLFAYIIDIYYMICSNRTIINLATLEQCQNVQIMGHLFLCQTKSEPFWLQLNFAAHPKQLEELKSFI